MLLARLFPLRCPGCGAPAEPLCAACADTLRPAPAQSPPSGIDAWVAAFAYEGVARRLVTGVKYRRAHAALPWLAGRVMAAVEAGGLSAPEAVTWAPTTAARRRDRGFDHAELLARAVARRAGLPARATLRRLPGAPQTGRAGPARRAGPAFALRRILPPPHLLLVDDVATTGATLAAAAATLRGGGTRTVSAATVARTPLTRNARGPRHAV